MKILYTFGGIPLYYDALLNKLVQKGVEVSVVIPPEKSDILGEGVKVIDSKETPYKIIYAEEKKSFLGKSCFPQLPGIIRQEKPDILIAGWPFFLQHFSQPALRGALKAMATKFVIREIPFRVPPYGKLLSYFKNKPIFDEDMKQENNGVPFIIRQWVIMLLRRYCYRRADAALAYASVGKELLPTYGLSPDKVFVTYNTNDTDAMFAIKEQLSTIEVAPNKNPFRIIHVGRLVKWKRVDLLLSAFAGVADTFAEAELIIIGDGPELARLKKQSADLNIDSKTVFTGAIYDSKVIASHLSTSAIYVLAGMGGLSINDAMTFGLPVICSVCDGTEKDLVIDHINGFYFEEGDRADLTQKLHALLENPTRALEMGKESWKVIRDKINLETVSDRYIEAFERILSPHLN